MLGCSYGSYKLYKRVKNSRGPPMTGRRRGITMRIVICFSVKFGGGTMVFFRWSFLRVNFSSFGNSFERLFYH